MKNLKNESQVSLRDTRDSRCQDSREGKDEMNLVEHPFALLSSRGDSRSVIKLEWETERNGKMVQCAWSVVGHPELGLPTPFDERLYLVMLELTREANWLQQVPFWRADIVRRLGLTRQKAVYEQLNDSFTRLHNLSINARHSFYNPKIRQYDTLRNFSLLHRVVISDESGRRAGSDEPASHFEWSNEFYASILAGNVRTLDLNIALSLERPLALRLLRYLDKKRHDGKPTFKVGLRKLCELHLGMVPHRYESKYRDRLTPAHEELISRKFIDGVEFQKARARGEDGTVAIYTFAPQAEDTVLEYQQVNEVNLTPSTGDSLRGADSIAPAALLHQGRSREHEKHPQAYAAVWRDLNQDEREKAARFGLEWHEFLRTYHDHVLVKAIRVSRKDEL
jgi:hypothetical protein